MRNILESYLAVCTTFPRLLAFTRQTVCTSFYCSYCWCTQSNQC